MSQLKFFTEKQFTTMVKAMEVLIDTGGNNAIDPSNAGMLIDEMRADSKSPALDVIPKIFNQLEHIVPPLFLFFNDFSKLSLSKRKKVLTKLINNEGLFRNDFRDLARALKVMSTVSYYGSPEGMAQVGFVPFDQRQRVTGLNQTPIIHQDN